MEDINIPPELLKEIPVLESEYGDLFLIPLEDKLIVCRPLSIQELNIYEYLAERNPDEAEELVLKTIIYPKDCTDEYLDNLDAGVVGTLISTVVSNSNFPNIKSLNEYINEQRNYALTGEGSMIAWVCAAFPSLKPHDVMQMGQKKLAKMVALAEIVLQRSLDIQDPEELNKKKGKKKGTGMMMPPGFTGIDPAKENKEMGY